MKVLLVEDDETISSYILKGMEQEGYAIDHAPDGEEGLYLAQHESYDVAIVDLMLPKLTGQQIIRQVRRGDSRLPILILSARDSVDDRVEGLNIGADDYLVKPFAFSELLARIQALLRRSTLTPEATSLELDDLKLDLQKHKVYRGGDEVYLQPREFALLEYLLRNKGRVVTKTMIMEHVWDYNFDPQTNIVESRICHLRNKVDRDYDTKLIHTVRGFGYVLEVKK